MSLVTSVEQLEALYGLPGEASIVKELDHVISEYAAFIEASPFVALATSGPEGLDCSPRGDLAGFVRLIDEKTLMMPDRRGNNRADSLKNIIRDPRVGLLFLVPGSGTTLRVNGRAHITTDVELCASFTVDGKPARSVTVISVDTVYFQCARAIVRSEIWNAAKHVDPKSLPTPGQILEITSRKNIDGEIYDKEWPERAKKTRW
ncbi:pyridoxamine 5'-phosphate oxidase family protein [Mesorhizobium sp. M1B.F.Ca.ET.045.04.1.1]|uniref:pyridoxamine 5'-phosphate oxidase family protein n=1 Tax=Mesorhizobium sp. M1B.F.Ca.ET.045.04.1.1 TaxID=2493673 RepID=UPI000F764CCA|nr:pyridoxamine 5'-phosphate oxidase family protein [Mesorhizobium sp. M1B.F.Ca.ET.045.04.1.1]AZO30457.1 pyridoxamine 5'-phosphate oxidase family protein [Mesorhizobium sp. M1B.F.Ca.ET.045.04.1.1]